MPGRMVVDDDEQIIANLLKQMRRLRARLATGQVRGTHDQFVAAATPQTTYTLTYIPVDGTAAMYVNGLEQTEGTDYTVNYSTAVVTFVTALTTGDQVDFRYLITDWLVARSLPADNGSPLADTFNRANSLTTINPASDGGEWTAQDSTVWGITSNKGVVVTPDITTASVGNNQNLLYSEFGSSVHTVTIDNTRTATTDSSALWVAWDPVAKTGYLLLFDSSSGFISLRKCNNRTLTTLSTISATAWTGGSTTLRLSYDGAGLLTAKQNTGSGFVTLGTYTDGTPLTGTCLGFSQNAGNVAGDAWDNFTAT